jgi:hypothetical protein
MIYSVMVLKVFKFECIWYLFRSLEVIKKGKEKKWASPLRLMKPKLLG